MIAPRSQRIAGLLLIAIGLIILAHRYIQVDFYFLRSYGLLLAGVWFFVAGISRQPRSGIYFATLAFTVGLYYLLGDLGYFEVSQGLTISVLTILLGFAEYPKFWLQTRNWKDLLYGNLIIIIGLLFLSYHLGLIADRAFDTIINDYWPVALIIVGLAYLIHSLRLSGRVGEAGGRDSGIGG